MKRLAFLSALIFLSCLTNKNVERKITIKPIGWQFPLTSEIIFKDSAFNSKGEVVGEIPNVLGLWMELQSAVVLLSANIGLDRILFSF